MNHEPSAQNPLSFRIGILVVAIAVIIMISRGIAAILTEKPISISTPQTISKDATNCARNSGFVNPIFSNRPEPTSSGKESFGSPRKEKPTRQLTWVRQTCNHQLILKQSSEFSPWSYGFKLFLHPTPGAIDIS
ncbi:MAG: hypothetical protein MZU84_00600 [Sphingobacterium sp.]|nr:hypothetical protein [Sphingobacterium sp.]